MGSVNDFQTLSKKWPKYFGPAGNREGLPLPKGGEEMMTSGDTIVLLVEVGVIALAALVALFRGR